MAGTCLHELFEKQVSQTPDAIAVACAGGVLTYAQLNERANRLAHYLQNLGVGPETLVGISLRRSLDLIVGLLGIIKAGGAYVPLPPDHPSKRLAHILEDSQIRIVVTLSELEYPFRVFSSNETGASIGSIVSVCVDSQSEVIRRQPSENPCTKCQPANLVYVIHTSGSTGSPKGVAVEHNALVNHCLTFAEHFELNPSDRVLQFAPLRFDVSAEEIFPTLLTGGRVLWRPELTTASIADFHAFIRDQQITILNLPTSYWNEWMKERSEEHTSE